MKKRPSLSQLQSLITEFTHSDKPFKLVKSFPATKWDTSAPTSLYVLDSSFNPPTKAHLNMALSGLKMKKQKGTHQDDNRQKILLLLLALKNADKAEKPASFPQRLSMMQIFAQDLLDSASNPSAQVKEGEEDHSLQNLRIDVGIISHALFSEKAASLSKDTVYNNDEVHLQGEQVFIIGYDTLIRLLDPKYYAQDQKLRVLDPFFEQVRILVKLRNSNSSSNGEEEQMKCIEDIRNGSREDEGARKEWAEKIEVLESIPGAPSGAISSTKAREAIERQDDAVLKEMVTDTIRAYVQENDLYV